MKTISKIAAAVAMIAVASPAMAGGFSFQSKAPKGTFASGKSSATSGGVGLALGFGTINSTSETYSQSSQTKNSIGNQSGATGTTTFLGFGGALISSGAKSSSASSLSAGGGHH